MHIYKLDLRYLQESWLFIPPPKGKFSYDVFCFGFLFLIMTYATNEAAPTAPAASRSSGSLMAHSRGRKYFCISELGMNGYIGNEGICKIVYN
jgi:hypothetical protein